MKPSEISPAMESLIAELIPKYLSEVRQQKLNQGHSFQVSLLTNVMFYSFFLSVILRFLRSPKSVFLDQQVQQNGGKIDLIGWSLNTKI